MDGNAHLTTAWNGEIDVDTVFRVLSHERRRAVIRELSDQDEVAVGELVTTVFTTAAGLGTNREGVKADLYHTHLPKLDEADVIDYDADTETVTRGPEYEHVWRVQESIRAILAE